MLVDISNFNASQTVPVNFLGQALEILVKNPNSYSSAEELIQSKGWISDEFRNEEKIRAEVIEVIKENPKILKRVEKEMLRTDGKKKKNQLPKLIAVLNERVMNKYDMMLVKQILNEELVKGLREKGKIE